MSANDSQVAGTHYAATYQHWDLVADAGMDYFAGQISKYVCRHAKKNGLQDLKKAEHFAVKLCELFSNGHYAPALNKPYSTRTHALDRFFDANELSPAAKDVVRLLIHAPTLSGTEAALLLVRALIRSYTCKDTSDPQPLGYVNQDRS